MLNQLIFPETAQFVDAYNYMTALMRKETADVKVSKATADYDKALATVNVLTATVNSPSASPVSNETMLSLRIAERALATASLALETAEQERGAWVDAMSACETGYTAWLEAVTAENADGFANSKSNAARVLRLFIAMEDHAAAAAMEADVFTTDEAAALAAALHKCAFTFDRETGKRTARKEDYVKVKECLQALVDKFALPIADGKNVRNRIRVKVSGGDVNAILAQYVTSVTADYEKDGDGMPSRYTGTLTYKTSIYSRKTKGGKTVYASAPIRRQVSEILFAKVGHMLEKEQRSDLTDQDVMNMI